MKSPLVIENRSKRTVLASRAAVADRSWKRMKGLLGSRRLQEGQGLVITPCNGVHTFFMQYPIDLVIINVHGEVLSCRPDLQPYRVAFCFKPGAVTAVELPAGTISRTGTKAGDWLSIIGAKKGDEFDAR